MIEPIALHEVSQVAALIERAVRTSGMAADAEKEYFLENIRSNLELWQQNPGNALHLKFIRNGELVGVVMVKSFWNLCHLVVEPEYQKHGIGKALMEAALVACRDRSPRKYVRLNSSRNARKFYKRLGFTLVPDAPAAYAGVQYEFTF